VEPGTLEEGLQPSQGGVVQDWEAPWRRRYLLGRLWDLEYATSAGQENKDRHQEAHSTSQNISFLLYKMGIINTCSD
jgi:argininosuccinate synthase